MSELLQVVVKGQALFSTAAGPEVPCVGLRPGGNSRGHKFVGPHAKSRHRSGTKEGGKGRGGRGGGVGR